jgi:hypothetical protein
MREQTSRASFALDVFLALSWAIIEDFCYASVCWDCPISHWNILVCSCINLPTSWDHPFSQEFWEFFLIYICKLVSVYCEEPEG